MRIEFYKVEQYILLMPNSQHTYEYHTSDNASSALDRLQRNKRRKAALALLKSTQLLLLEAEPVTCASIRAGPAVYYDGGGADALRFPLCDAAVHEALPRAGAAAGAQHHGGGVRGVYCCGF